jgi:hypothetical protein
MPKLAQLPRSNRVQDAPGPKPDRVLPQHLYFAFLSYSHVDAGWASGCIMRSKTSVFPGRSPAS